MKEYLETEEHKELPPNEQRINELLENTSISRELDETDFIASHVRRGGLLKEQLDKNVAKGIIRSSSPEFKNIMEFQSALYAHERKIMYLDDWNVPHSDIAGKNDLLAKDSFGSQILETGNYTSGDILVLRAIPNIKVMRIDSLFGFYLEDLVAVKKLGYSVLSPNLNWLIEGSRAIVRVPSVISKGLD
jgi:hypothetical protein